LKFIFELNFQSKKNYAIKKFRFFYYNISIVCIDIIKIQYLSYQNISILYHIVCPYYYHLHQWIMKWFCYIIIFFLNIYKIHFILQYFITNCRTYSFSIESLKDESLLFGKLWEKTYSITLIARSCNLRGPILYF